MTPEASRPPPAGFAARCSSCWGCLRSRGSLWRPRSVRRLATPLARLCARDSRGAGAGDPCEAGAGADRPRQRAADLRDRARRRWVEGEGLGAVACGSNRPGRHGQRPSRRSGERVADAGGPVLGWRGRAAVGGGRRRSKLGGSCCGSGPHTGTYQVTAGGLEQRFTVGRPLSRAPQFTLGFSSPVRWRSIRARLGDRAGRGGVPAASPTRGCARPTPAGGRCARTSRSPPRGPEIVVDTEQRRLPGHDRPDLDDHLDPDRDPRRRRPGRGGLRGRALPGRDDRARRRRRRGLHLPRLRGGLVGVELDPDRDAHQRVWPPALSALRWRSPRTGRPR